jgi:hypothetical protein
MLSTQAEPVSRNRPGTGIVVDRILDGKQQLGDSLDLVDHQQILVRDELGGIEVRRLQYPVFIWPPQ